MTNAEGAPGPLRSRHVELRPVMQSDMEWLYSVMVLSAGSRWRYRGKTPSPAVFASDLWSGVHAQFVVVDDRLDPCGIVGLYNANPTASHSHLFAVGEHGRHRAVTEGAGLLIEWAFAELDFDKIWIETPEFNLQQFASLTTVAEVEGRLRDFDHWQGRFWDLYILSLSRTRWQEMMSSRVRDRSRNLLPADANGFDRTRLELTMIELWPIDSLGFVELLTDIEEMLGVAVDDRLLDDLALLDLPDAFRLLSERIDAQLDGLPGSTVGGPRVISDDRRDPVLGRTYHDVAGT